MTTQDEALKWIAELFETSAEDLRPDTPRADIPAWDSLGVLTLMAGLDEHFQIVMNDGDAQRMSSVQDILELLRKNGKLTA